MESLQNRIDRFIGWMEKDGMLGRWENQRKMKGVAGKRRALNNKIRIEKSIQETIAELERE
jgi:hypothetical protein